MTKITYKLGYVIYSTSINGKEKKKILKIKLLTFFIVNTVLPVENLHLLSSLYCILQNMSLFVSDQHTK